MLWIRIGGSGNSLPPLGDLNTGISSFGKPRRRPLINRIPGEHNKRISTEINVRLTAHHVPSFSPATKSMRMARSLPMNLNTSYVLLTTTYSMQMYARCRIEGTFPQQTCFTFDDGLKCQYEVALPVLKRRIRAAWHVFLFAQERIPEQLEVYKYFQAQFYTDINDFYRDFFNKAEATYGERVQTAPSCASVRTRRTQVFILCLIDSFVIYVISY